MKLNNESTNVNKGNIIFKHNNIKHYKKGIFMVLMNLLISIIFGFVGSLLFISIYNNANLNKKDDSNFNIKYDSNVTNVINKLNQSIVGVNSFIKTLNENNEVVLTQNNMTGIIYSEDGYIITNFNGLDGADKIYIKFPTTLDLVREAKIVSYDKEYDLCLLKIEGNGYTKGVFKKDISDVTHGLKVVSIGNMIGDSNSYSVYSGIVNGVELFNNNYKNDVKIIKSDFSVNSLNTGGPICDVNGEILGINSLKLNYNYGLNNGVFISVSSPNILEFIDSFLNGAT